MIRGLLAGVALASVASSVSAGAWTQKKGQAQVIVKAEVMRADQGFDPSGLVVPLAEAREDRAVGVFAEYGITDRWTLQFKGDWQSGEDAFVDYQGTGPTEIGLTWQVHRDDRNAVSLYAGYARAGEGRNAGYAAPGVGQQDWEVRLSAGRSFGDGEGWVDRLTPGQTFVEVQAARRMRDGLPDETRADFTVGSRFEGGWMVLGQAFGGMTDDGGARWLSIETSVVRDFGPWSLQAGWRRTVAGQETPISEGPVIALWHRF
jgi:hypothetical protein